jgi:hypothetical protein
VVPIAKWTLKPDGHYDAAPYARCQRPAGRARRGYALLRAEATRLAGAPGDIARRVALHHHVYLDSGGNHTFPLVALHGALWAAGFFETTGRLGQALRVRYFYDGRERAHRMAMLDGFANGFKAVNRQVFIDTYTNYFYTRRYGGHRSAAGILHPDLFAALVAMHEKTRAGAPLSPEQKRELFSLSLQFEQEVTVAPGIQAETEKFDCPILRFLCLRPVVRFSYFPVGTYLMFRSFADKAERIDKAMRSYRFAERAGWPKVEAAMRAYQVLPDSYWDDRQGYLTRLS